MRARFLRAALILVFVAALLSARAQAGDVPWQWSNVERVVVFADVHGAYPELVGVLRQAGVISADNRWNGGRTHLVSLGDLLSRGPESRKVLDLLMRLEGEARAAGGDVHVTLGNHEVMHLLGELNYATPLELAQYTEFETPAAREAAYARLRATGWKVGESDEAARTAFAERFPAGYFGHRAAFAPDGRYGAWLLGRPALLRINEFLFMHGGLPPALAEVDARTFVDSLNTELRTAVLQLRELIAAGLIDPDTPPGERERLARERLAAHPVEEPAAQHLLEVIEAIARFENRSLLTTEAGPLWYRRTALCLALTESEVVAQALANFGAQRAVIGHTPTLTGRVVSRFDGRVVRLDTGMLTLVYRGRPAALEITRTGLRAYYAGETEARPVTAEPRRVGRRPGATLDDDALETFLREAPIVATEALPASDFPEKVTLERDGVRVAAIFKSESAGRGATADSPRWQHEVAAYVLDRQLGLDLVPVTVTRTIEGRRGALQFWIDNTVSHREAIERSLATAGYCPVPDQHALMLAFDALIKNLERRPDDILYERDSWMLRLIDHARAFRLGSVNLPAPVPPEFARRLAALTPKQLETNLSPWLRRDEIKALLTRRAALLTSAKSPD